MKLSYDLHVHSCLSPCAEDESTPRSIALLAEMLGLNILALTDHNSTRNLPAFFKAAKETNIIPIAGLEVNVAEEIHVLCLFPELEQALEFDEKYVRPSLMQFLNKPEKNGNQLIMDENDEVIGTEPLWLNLASSIPLYKLSEPVNLLGGAMIPAHIDRPSWGVIGVLGDVPDDCGFNCVEITQRDEAIIAEMKKKHPYLNKCGIIHDSDAHRLESISLPVNFLEVEEKTARSVIKALKGR